MIELTIRHYESKWTYRSMSHCNPPSITETVTLEHEPDYSVLGEQTTPWSVTTGHKQAQFANRDHAKRVDHIFVVDVRPIAEGQPR